MQDVSNISRKLLKTGTEETELNYYYTEITKENVNKWEAIKEIASILGIKKEEIVAIGDNQNDLDMVQNAGLGIIIGNSALSKKKLENYVVSSNDEDGVAEAIDKYVLRG